MEQALLREKDLISRLPHYCIWIAQLKKETYAHNEETMAHTEEKGNQ